MQTPLTATASKWIGTNGKALWPGDLINNDGCYDEPPDYSDPLIKMLHINAEKYNAIGSTYRAAYQNQGVFVTPVTSGFGAYRLLGDYIPKISGHSLKLSPKGDQSHLTVARIGDVLDPQASSTLMKESQLRSQVAAILFAKNLRNPKTGERDMYIIDPNQGEGFARLIHKVHSLTRGAKWFDSIYEKHFWGPKILFDATFIPRNKNVSHAWSRNGSLESGVALAIQYGSPLPLKARKGSNIDVIDSNGKSISIVDQAWEDARHLIFEITKEYKYQGKTYKARSETAAALLLSRFMHDHLYRTDVPVTKSGLDKDLAHDVVKAHYASKDEMARFDTLKDAMLPFLAAQCNWPTLHRILDNDPALKAYWEGHVMPSLPKLKSDEAIKREVLSYYPRGGYRDNELDAWVTKTHAHVYGDEPEIEEAYDHQGISSILKATLADAFSEEYEPKINNDRLFAKLGHNGSPKDRPDPDNLTFQQGAAIMAVAAFGDGIVPLDRPHTYLYIDDSAGGVAAAAYMHKHGIQDPAMLSRVFDIHADAGSAFSESVAREAVPDYVDRQRELTFTPKYAPFRQKYGIGNIISVTDIAGALNYSGMREATKTPMHMALSGSGSMLVTVEGKKAVVDRLTSAAMHGIIIPAGMTSPLQAQALTAALNVIMGKAKRAAPNMDYHMNIVMDYDYWKPAALRDPKNLVKLDMADLMIHIGMQVKAMLEQPNVPANSDLYTFMARLLEFYEMQIDPVRRNIDITRDPRSGKDSKAPRVHLEQVDAQFRKPLASKSHGPESVDTEYYRDNPAYDAYVNQSSYKAFRVPERQKPQDFYKKLLAKDGVFGGDGAKADLAHHIWVWMRAEAIPHPSKPGQNWVVSGNLTARAIQHIDDMALEDLHEDYRKSKKAWSGLNAHERANIFNQNTILVESPGVNR